MEKKVFKSGFKQCIFMASGDTVLRQISEAFISWEYLRNTTKHRNHTINIVRSVCITTLTEIWFYSWPSYYESRATPLISESSDEGRKLFWSLAPCKMWSHYQPELLQKSIYPFATQTSFATIMTGYWPKEMLSLICRS